MKSVHESVWENNFTNNWEKIHSNLSKYVDDQIWNETVIPVEEQITHLLWRELFCDIKQSNSN